MKMLSLLVTAVALSQPLLASASENPVPAGKILSCRLMDRVTENVLDWKNAVVPTTHDEPVLLLLSGRGMVGRVKDAPTEIPGERATNLELEYRSGSEWGISRAFGNYRLDQLAKPDAIAEATLAEPVWGRELSLQCFVREQSPDLAEIALSTISYEYGNGYATGFCEGPNGWYCMDQLKRRAREDATRDGKWRCEARQGKADWYASFCNDNCSPFSLPHDAPSTYVNCNATCTVRCEMP